MHSETNEPSWMRPSTPDDPIKTPLLDNTNENDEVVESIFHDVEPAWVKGNNPTVSRPPVLESEVTPLKPGRPTKVSKSNCCCGLDAVLCYFRCFHVLVGCVTLVTLATNIYMIHKFESLRDLVIRCYLVAICIFIVFLEADVRTVVSAIAIFDNWFARGVLYVLLGLLTTDQYTIDISVQDVVGLMMGICGGLYILMALACLKQIKDNRVAELQALKDRNEP
eukprot:gene7304-14895_t